VETWWSPASSAAPKSSLSTAPKSSLSAPRSCGYVRTATNHVLPAPEAIMRSLLADTLYLIDIIGLHVALEADKARPRRRPA
jgi:hypothetical protein